MDMNEYRIRGKQMVDYICYYYETVHERRVFPNVRPGYLSHILPKEAPKKPDRWEDIMNDIETKIMPGITHWNHPRFFAYFPSGNCYASFLGDMLSDAIGCIGFTWAASPACTELETIVLDWFGKALNLPDFFLYFTPGSIGGGVIQGSASECILVSMLGARDDAVRYLKEQAGDLTSDDSTYLHKIVAYTSDEAHSCVEKAAKIAMVKIRILKTDHECSLRGPVLAEAIEADIQDGLFPFFVSATLGSTGNCSFDNLKEIGPIVKKLPKCWLHVDAAYAGSAFICPEVRYLKEGIEFADSFNTNCNKFLNVCFDCSCLWLKDRFKVIRAMTVDPVYLQHENASVTISYRHWMIPLSRRFRSLKLWFTLRNYGIEKLQNFIRHHIRMAELFERLVRQDDRFEVVNIVRLGLVCFRLKGRDELNQDLLTSINREANIHIIPCLNNNRFTLRFAIVYEHTRPSDVEYAWSVIQHHGTETLLKYSNLTVMAAPLIKTRRAPFGEMAAPDAYDRLKRNKILNTEDTKYHGIPIEELSLLSSHSIDDDL